jgi:amidase
MLPLAPSLDTVGVLARDPVLLRDTWSVLAGDDTSASAPPSEVVVAADAFEWIDADAANAVARAADVIASRLGCTFQTTDLRGFTSADTAALLARLQGREVWAAHGAWVEPNLDAFLPEVAARLRRCREWADDPADDVEADDARRTTLRRAFGALVGPGTCVVLPVLHDLTPRRDATDDDLVAFRAACFRLTAPASLGGAPEVVVPVHHERSGRTFGVGLLGAPGADAVLLAAAVAARAEGVLTV